MYITFFFRLALRSCLTALVMASVFAAGCDRATPEKLSSKLEPGSHETDESSKAVPPPDEGSGNSKLTNEQRLLRSEDPPVPNRVDASGKTADVDSPVAMKTIDTTDLMNRSFMSLKPVVTDRPDELIAHLGEVDAALRDLILAGTTNIVDADIFSTTGLRLGQMKFAAGEKLAALAGATTEQRKIGAIAQLVALSHMSGLKDKESAKKLEKFASALLQSTDHDLAHQGRVVLLGFRLQDLQNGSVSEPTQLLADLDGLFQRPSDAGFPEMMVLQQAQQVLSEMGFAEAAGKIDQLVVSKFMDSPDLQLSSAAWSLAIANSQSFRNYNAAMQDIYEGKEKAPQMLLGAARGLYDELPNSTTLLQFVNLSTDLEYRGLVDIASELSAYTKLKTATLQNSAYVDAITGALESQSRRLGIRGQTLALEGLVDFDGKPLDWSIYKGKVVLIDFWATWCEKCRLELPNIRKAKEEFSSHGFDVLSINMDEDLAEARKFLTNNPLPWNTVHSAELTALGFKSALAKRLGVSAIPFLVLVAADGKVAAVHVRGDRLAPTVRSMIGDGLSN